MTLIDVPVSEGTRVYLNFSVSLEDGSEVDSNFGGDPVEFEVGDGSLLPGFERLLFGMSGGQRQMFTVAPENAFGQPNDNNVHQLPRSQFEGDSPLEIGGKLVKYIVHFAKHDLCSFISKCPEIGSIFEWANPPLPFCCRLLEYYRYRRLDRTLTQRKGFVGFMA